MAGGKCLMVGGGGGGTARSSRLGRMRELARRVGELALALGLEGAVPRQEVLADLREAPSRDLVIMSRQAERRRVGRGRCRACGGVRGGGHAWGAVSYSRRSDASAAVGVTAGRDVEPTTAARRHRSSSREWAYWQRPSSR